MNWQPLLDAPPLYRVHAGIALAAVALGAVQLAGPKGTVAHRVLGYLWVACMAAIALTSFAITALTPGSFSAIHLLSIFTLVMLPLAVWRARRGQMRRHAIAMIALYVGALLIAGGFTLLPGRIMNHVVFG